MRKRCGKRAIQRRKLILEVKLVQMSASQQFSDDLRAANASLPGVGCE
jgi:hypothetical protein